MKSRLTRKEMLPLVGMTVSAFIFNTSEFMPIGLLTDIAKSFSISESKAGMLITVYSWIVLKRHATWEHLYFRLPSLKL